MLEAEKAEGAPPAAPVKAVAGANNLDKAFDQAAPTDVSETFKDLLQHRDHIFDKIIAKLPMKRIEACPELEAFNGLADKDKQFGSVKLYTGQGIEESPIDLCVLAWMGDASKGFTNLHLTIYMKGSTDAPHFGFALGTVPQIFFYVDLAPRCDVQLDLDAMKYMEPLNARTLTVLGDPDIKYFHSRSTHVRSTISPIGLVGLVDREVFDAKVIDHLEAYADHFIKCALEGKAPADPAVMAARDVKWRQTVVDNDPMNVMADRFVGVEMKDKLLLALRGDIRD